MRSSPPRRHLPRARLSPWRLRRARRRRRHRASAATCSSLTEPFNVLLLAELLIAGAALGTLPLMVPLALLVYGVGVVRSYRDPATAERAAERADD